jgi:hypothetical protein
MTYISPWKAVGENISNNSRIRALAPDKSFFPRTE